MKFECDEKIGEVIDEFMQLYEHSNYKIEEVVKKGYCKRLGGGMECEALLYKGVCVKCYHSVYHCDCNTKIWESIPKSRYYPSIYRQVYNIIFMEYIEGCNLSKLTKEEVRSKGVIFKLLDNAEFLYNNKIIPFDLHSDNIIVNQKGEIKIVDVGEFSTRFKEETILKRFYNDYLNELKRNYLY